MCWVITVCDRHTNNCETLLHQPVEVSARIIITPHFKVGKPRVYCVDAETELYRHIDRQAKRGVKRRKKHKLLEKIKFFVEQTLCVQIPVSFKVKVENDCNGIVRCGKPSSQP